MLQRKQVGSDYSLFLTAQGFYTHTIKWLQNKQKEVVVQAMQSELVQLVNSWLCEDKELRVPKKGLDIPIGDRSVSGY